MKDPLSSAERRDENGTGIIQTKGRMASQITGTGSWASRVRKRSTALMPAAAATVPQPNARRRA